jgi:hypothetical protein
MQIYLKGLRCFLISLTAKFAKKGEGGQVPFTSKQPAKRLKPQNGWVYLYPTINGGANE